MDRTEPVRVNLNLRDEEYKTMHSFTLLVISYFTLPAFILGQEDIIPQLNRAVSGGRPWHQREMDRPKPLKRRREIRAKI